MDEVEGPAASRWDGHILLLYANQQQRQAGVTAWVRSGLERGDKVLYAQDPEDHTFFRALAERGLDVEQATSTGQLAVLPPDEFYPGTTQERLVDMALEEGYPAVRLSTEVQVALSLLTEARYREFETDTEELCTSRPVSALCQYDAAGAGLDRLVGAISSHPRLVQHDELRLHQVRDHVALDGEASLTTAPMLELALERACAESRSGSLTVDLSRLGFLDVAGCRAMLVATAGFRDAGGHVFLERPQPHVRRTLRLLGVERLGQVFVVT